jgi:hypothetical protein
MHLLIIIILLLLLLNNTCNTCSKSIEPFKLYRNTGYNKSDLKFVPASEKDTPPLFNNYYITPNKYLPSTDGFLDTLYRTDPNYYNYVFDFPMDEPRIENKYKRDFNKSYLSMFRNIPLDGENVDAIYEENKLKDIAYVFDPLSTTRDVDTPDKIMNEILPRRYKNTCSSVKCPLGKKVDNKKRNDILFSKNNIDIEKMCCGPL